MPTESVTIRKLDNNTSPYIGKDAQIYDGSWDYNYYAHAELKDKSSYLKNVSKELDQENGNFENIRQIHSSSLSSKVYDGSYTGSPVVTLNISADEWKKHSENQWEEYSIPLDIKNKLPKELTVIKLEKNNGNDKNSEKNFKYLVWDKNPKNKEEFIIRHLDKTQEFHEKIVAGSHPRAVMDKKRDDISKICGKDGLTEKESQKTIERINEKLKLTSQENETIDYIGKSKIKQTAKSMTRNLRKFYKTANDFASESQLMISNPNLYDGWENKREKLALSSLKCDCLALIRIPYVLPH